MKKKSAASEKPSLASLLDGKSQQTFDLFNYFVDVYKKIGSVSIHPAKTMIGVATSRKRIAYVTQLGKDFIHVVLPFDKPHADNLCFQKIAQVPGDSKQFNHHLRIYLKEDINDEVMKFMKLAYENGLE